MKSSQPTFLSLFCGCGGLDLGFRNAGFRCVGAFDVDPTAVNVHKQNLRSDVHQHDLMLSIPSLGNSAEVDVVVAGPPCQGFSTAGRNDPSDPRNLLLGVPARVAEIYSPSVILIENVLGVTSDRNKHHLEKQVNALRSLGYLTSLIRCNAHSHGVPQERKRMLLLGWKSRREVTVTIPMRQGGNLAEALRDVSNAAQHHRKVLPKNTLIGEIARKIKPGQKLSNVRGGQRSIHTWDIPGAFGAITPDERSVLETLLVLRRRDRKRSRGDADPVSSRSVSQTLGFPVSRTLVSLEKKGYVRRIDGNYDLSHTFNGKYCRLRLDKPSPTVHTRFGDPRYFLHPTEHRGFTVREAARIQTFPDTFSFAGTEDQQFRMIGNAVPPVLATIVANYILDTFVRDDR